MATPKLQGLSAAIHKLQYSVEERAGKLIERIATTDQRADKAFKGAHVQLDGIEGHVEDVNKFLDIIEGSNSGDLLPKD